MTNQTAVDRAAAIADAIGSTMLLGLQDAELFDEPGRERIREWVKWISETVAALPAVLPAPVDRAAVLREAADALGRMDYDTDSNDYGYDTYRDAWNGGVMDAAGLLRRLAVEAQPAQPQADQAAP